jgi:hypothetical protein
MGSDPSDTETTPGVIHVGGDVGDTSVILVLYAQEIDLDAVTAVLIRRRRALLLDQRSTLV